MKKNSVSLKNKHKGQDIWVVASGPSLNFIDKAFFKNKLVIGVNRVGEHIPCKYSVLKDCTGIRRLIQVKKGGELICSKYNCGTKGAGDNWREFHNQYIFDHPSLKGAPDLNVVGTNQMVVSSSTITSAIHIAAFMGAANIIISGHDCGKIDGKMNFDNYYQHTQPIQGAQKYVGFITGGLEAHTVSLRKKLKEVYGVNICSLNPFVNFGLEGHKYER